MVRVTRNKGTFDAGSIEAALRAQGLSPRRWSNGPGDTYAVHSHTYHKVLYCLRGSIVFRLADGTDIELHPGNRLDIEAHAATVGAAGVVCIEAAHG